LSSSSEIRGELLSAKKRKYRRGTTFLSKKKKKKKKKKRPKKKKKKKELGACRRLDFPAKGFLQYSWTDRT